MYTTSMCNLAAVVGKELVDDAVEPTTEDFVINFVDILTNYTSKWFLKYNRFATLQYTNKILNINF